MTREDIELNVREMAAEQVDRPVENVELKNNLIRDLGATSLDIVELSVDLEEKYDLPPLGAALGLASDGAGSRDDIQLLEVVNYIAENVPLEEPSPEGTSPGDSPQPVV